MRLLYLALFFLFATFNFLIAQVGINTSKPMGLLHIANTINLKENNIVFTDDGSLGIGTTYPKAKLDVEGSMQILKSPTEVNDINNYVLTSDADGVGSLQFNTTTLQNKVSSYNFELSTKNLYTEARFTLTSINRNELNLTNKSSMTDNIAFNPVPAGVYMIICNFELTNANSIATVQFSKTSATQPLPSNDTNRYFQISGKKTSISFLTNLSLSPSQNFIYLALTTNNRYKFSNWNNFTYWDKPWESLASGENYMIKGSIEIIKLG